MNPVIGLSLGRIAVGAIALARPEVAAKALQLDPTANPQLPFMARLFGSREIALGLVTLFTRGKGRASVVALGALVDAADVGTAYLAMKDGSVSQKSAGALIGPAAGAVVVGVSSIVRR